MPDFIVTAPDGHKYKVTLPRGMGEDEAIRQVQMHLTPPPPEPEMRMPEPVKEQAGFGSSFMESARNLYDKAVPAFKFGAAGTNNQAQRDALLKADESQRAHTSFHDIDSAGKAWDWAKQTAGSTAGALAVPGLGAMGTQLLTKGPGAAKAVGLGLMAGQYAVDNLVRQADTQKAAVDAGQTPQETSLGKMAVATAGQTGLDVIGFKIFAPVFKSFPVVGKLFGQSGEAPAKDVAEKLAAAFANGTVKQYAGGIIKGFGKGMAFEIPQEVAQTAFERWQAGLPLTGEDAKREYIEAGAGAILLGSSLGGAKGAIETRQQQVAAQEWQRAKEEAAAPPTTEVAPAVNAADAPVDPVQAAAEKEKADAELDAYIRTQIAVNPETKWSEGAKAAAKGWNIKPEGPENLAKVNEMAKLYAADEIDLEGNKPVAGVTVAPPPGTVKSNENIDPTAGTTVPDPLAGGAAPTTTGVAGPSAGLDPAAALEKQRLERQRQLNVEADVPKYTDDEAIAGLEKSYSNATGEFKGLSFPQWLDAKYPTWVEKLKDPSINKKTRGFTQALVDKTQQLYELREEKDLTPGQFIDHFIKNRKPTDANSTKVVTLEPKAEEQETGSVNGKFAASVPNNKSSGTNTEPPAGDGAAVEPPATGTEKPVTTRVAPTEPSTDQSGTGKGAVDTAVAPKAKAPEAKAPEAKAATAKAEREAKAATAKAEREAKAAEKARLKAEQDAKKPKVGSEPYEGTALKTYHETLFEAQDFLKLLRATIPKTVSDPAARRELQNAHNNLQREIAETNLHKFQMRKSSDVKKKEKDEETIKKLRNIIDSVQSNLLKSEVGQKKQKDNEVTLKGRVKAEHAAEVLRLGKGTTSGDLVTALSVGDMNEVSKLIAAGIKATGDRDSVERIDAIAVRDILHKMARSGSATFETAQNALGIVIDDLKKFTGKLKSMYDENPLNISFEDLKLANNYNTNETAKRLYKQLRDAEVITGEKNPILNKEAAGTVLYGAGVNADVQILSDEQQRLRNSVTAEVANALAGVDFSSSKVVTENMSKDDPVLARLRKEGKLAEYDPKTDTFYFTSDGMNTTTVLHEMVHAATVKTLYQYKNDPSALTDEQQDAAKHIHDLMALAKKHLGAKYQSAFEDKDGYEFIAYAMSDLRFQQDLAELRSPTLAKYSGAKHLWDALVQGLYKLFGISVFPAGERDNEQQQRLIRGYRGNLLLETAAAFEQILAPPMAGIDVNPLAMTAAVPASVRDARKEVDENQKGKYIKEGSATRTKKLFTTQRGFDFLIKKFQNNRIAVKRLEEYLTRSGLANYSAKGSNNLYTGIVLASGQADTNVKEYLDYDMRQVEKNVGLLSKELGLSTEETLRELQVFMTARHEPERRMVKYIRTVPLTQAAADARAKIYARLESAEDLTKDDNAEANKLREEVMKLVFVDGDPSKGVTKNVNSLGYSPANSKIVDINNEYFNVVGGLTPAKAAEVMGYYQGTVFASANTKQIIAGIDANMKNLQESTKKLNKEANYWSRPVANHAAFYGYQNYVPLKGKVSAASDNSDVYELGGSGGLGSDFAEGAYSFEGRESFSDDPLLQVMADSVRSALRAGRKDVTGIIKNLIQQGHIVSDKKNGTPEKVIEFKDRFSTEFRNLAGQNKIFHYLPDGKIEIYSIKADGPQKALIEGIRSTYTARSPVVDLMNRATSFIGQMHTRYNIPFAPMNFVRDTMTNAFAFATDMSATESKNFLAQVTKNVATAGLLKSARMAYLYNNQRFKEVEQLAKGDQFLTDLHEYMREGGKVSYVKGLASQSQFDELMVRIGRGPLAKGKEKFDHWADVWTESFEFTSRASAYSTAKGYYRNKLKDKGLTPEELDKAVRQQAAAFAKNLANFEQIGDYGRAAGALFMFFRPAATGAIRAIDSLAPAFQSEDSQVLALPKSIQDNPAAVAAFRKDFRERRESAQRVAAAMIGAGAFVYFMAAMMAGEDDENRNLVLTDDADRWTRYARLPVFGWAKENKFIQIPWGFGFGAFGALGAQLSAVAHGSSSPVNALANISTIALDSFLPVPVSRINPTDSPQAAGNWLMETITPSIARPVLSLVTNKDSMGRDIYNDRKSRFGNAYSGGEHVPELYRKAARWMADNVGINFPDSAGMDWSPNVLYFLANNYVDGASRVVQWADNTQMRLSGKREFDPKSDTMLIDSFIGKMGNIDARQFAEVEQTIKNYERRLKMFENNPEKKAELLDQNPFMQIVVDRYNKDVNSRLNPIRKMKNQYSASDLDPIDRKPLIKDLDMMQNIIKRQLLDIFESYDLTPSGHAKF